MLGCASDDAPNAAGQASLQEFKDLPRRVPAFLDFFSESSKRPT